MKTALITGASSGIGAETAHYFASKGLYVFLLGRNTENLKENTEKIKQKGGQAEYFTADVSQEKAVAEVFQKIKKQSKGLDVLINNAGTIEPIGRITDIDADRWLQCLETNLFGAYLCTAYSLKLMLLAQGGTVINISSGAASSPMEGWSAYCVSKAGLQMLMLTTHLEYAERGIRVFGFRPGIVDTEMQGKIRASGINRVSRLKRSELISPKLPAQALFWLLENGNEYLGAEIDIRDTDFLKKLNFSFS